MTGVVAGLAAGALAGSIAGWLMRGQLDEAAPEAMPAASEPEESLPESESPAAALTDVGAASKRDRESAALGVQTGPAGLPGDSEDMFSARLLQHAMDGIRSGWAQTRENEPSEDELQVGLGMFREQTLQVPGSVGRYLAKRRSEAEMALEDARTGGVFKVLERLDEGAEGPLFDVVDSSKVFDQFFQRAEGGPSLDGAHGIGRQDPVPDGSTLLFTAGVHSISDFGRKWRKHYPRDLTIRGAGKDATMIVLRSDLSAHDTVRNLTFENCTVHANGNYLFDVRTPKMSVTVRSCRLLGWTTGAGASCLFGTEALALRVVDTEITGVYNRHPASGKLFDVRTNGLLARFENCTFDALDMFRGTRGGATLVFVNCRTKDIFGNRKVVPSHARVLGTTMNWFAGEKPEDVKRDLNELFPDWNQELQRARQNGR